MNIGKLDLIKEYEDEINKIRTKIVYRELNTEPYKIFNLNAHEESISSNNITVKTLKEKRDQLIEEYGEEYEEDRKIYDRITISEDLRNDVWKLRNRVDKLEELDKILKQKAIPYEAEEDNFQIDNPYKVLIVGIFILSLIRILIVILS